MERPLRIRLALAVMLVSAGAAALLFLGVRVGSCLGPLGVTHVQCVKATGVYPTVGEGLPVLAIGLALAANVLVPGLLRPHAVAAALAAGGALAGTVAYLATRPLRLEGLDSRGTFLSVPLPVDLPAAVAAAVLGATGSIVGVRLLRWLTGRRTPRVHRELA